jgi:hypothetical protein
MAIRQSVTEQPAHVLRLRERIVELSDLLDEGDAPPTAAARSRCEALLTDVGAAALALAPPPSVSAMGDGDLIVEWRDAGRRLLLFILPTGATRLQQVTGEGEIVRAREVGRDIAPSTLESSLLWFSQPVERR